MMRKSISAGLAGILIAVLSALSVGSVSSPANAASTSAASTSASGCTWYVYKAKRNTTYWEYSRGNVVNGGFWKRPSKGTRMRTNEPFLGKNRTQIKYQVWQGKWKRLSLPKPYPYINRGAVSYQYCY